MRSSPDALVLFSGGLDSLLAACLLREQGLKVRCLHFFTPFFGSPAKVAGWRVKYGLDIDSVDVSMAFLAAFAHYPEHGTGKTLNPCIDCKIILLRAAREMLSSYGAKFIATGEVIGQRPMSQRSEALNVITKASATGDLLLRPLCAQHLRPTPMEESGLVDRSRLGSLSGRGRNGQLELARHFGVRDIPAPGGGCRLTEQENARRYWQILRPYWLNGEKPDLAALASDLELANLGRILFHEQRAILSIGRNEADNKRIAAACAPADILLRLPFPGPLALLRHPAPDQALLYEAAEILCSYAPRARLGNGPVIVSALLRGRTDSMAVLPNRHAETWLLPGWQEAGSEIRELRRKAGPGAD